METYEKQTGREDAAVAEAGDAAVRREVTITPVPYTGREQPIVIDRPDPDKFMLTKPA